MDDHQVISVRSRVVVLSRDARLVLRLAELCGPAVEPVRAASGYEAAAEILATEVTVLVIDFRSLPSAHARLLDLAHQMDVEMLGVGSTPGTLPIERLSGVRLVSWGDLPAAVLRLVGAARERDRAPAPGADVAPPQSAEPAELPEPAAVLLGDLPALEPVVEPPTPERERAEPPEPEPAQAEPQTPDQLLTPEELTALLEESG